MGPIEEQARAEVEILIARLNRGMPAGWRPAQPCYRRGGPVSFVLAMDIDLPNQVVLIIRTGKDGKTRGLVALPRQIDVPEAEDGPYPVRQAIRYAKRYARDYGFGRVVVDIEGSQLWDRRWGNLEIAQD